MKRVFVSAGIVSLVAFFSYCNSTKKATVEKQPKKASFNWTANIKPLMVEKCSPCHVEGKGNKLPLDNMDNVKTHVDDIIRRIEMHLGDRGYMPFKNPRLSDTAINMIKTWKAEGLL